MFGAITRRSKIRTTTHFSIYYVFLHLCCICAQPHNTRTISAKHKKISHSKWAAVVERRTVGCLTVSMPPLWPESPSRTGRGIELGRLRVCSAMVATTPPHGCRMGRSTSRAIPAIALLATGCGAVTTAAMRTSTRNLLLPRLIPYRVDNMQYASATEPLGISLTSSRAPQQSIMVARIARIVKASRRHSARRRATARHVRMHEQLLLHGCFDPWRVPTRREEVRLSFPRAASTRGCAATTRHAAHPSPCRTLCVELGSVSRSRPVQPR